jgi:hypothetical protein
MNRTFGMLAALALVTMSASVAARENWRRIGDVSSDAPYQRAVIEVGVDDGRFEALALEVQGVDVEVRSVRLVYGNGELDDLAVGDVFRAGTQSRRIALKRGTRFIKQVIVEYRGYGKTRIGLLGDMADAQLAWEVLGCQPVDFGIDRDVIRVGRNEGTFSKLMLSVEGNPVEFFDVKVIYGNGQPDVLQVHSVIAPRQETRAIDLSGRNRGIDHIEFVYRSIRNFTGPAKVCASGLLAAR